MKWWVILLCRSRSYPKNEQLTKTVYHPTPAQIRRFRLVSPYTVGKGIVDYFACTYAD